VRILYLNPFGGLGGAERALLDLAGGIRKARPDWHLDLISSSDGPFPARARGLGIRCTILPFPALLARTGDSDDYRGGALGRLSQAVRLCATGMVSTGYVARMRAEIRRLRPDLIHTNGFKMHVVGALSRPAGVPVLWHVRDYVSGRPVMARVLPILQRRCNLAITNSSSVAEDLKGVCPGLKIVPAHDAIDLADFAPDGRKLDLDRLANLSEAPQGTIRVGLVATMAHWKGHHIFLEALSRLPADRLVRGYIVGGSLYETAGSQHSIDELRALAAKLGISDRVGFTGFVDDPAAAMRSLDIVVHASTRPEPFGLTVAEAMASGRALITTASGGAQELVRDNVDCLATRRGDAPDLAQKIDRLVNDSALRERLSTAGRAAAQARFGIDRLVAEVLEAYRTATEIA